ncbi:MAG: M23 family metallopeptidase, partial [Alphaproteobacteria bacterium]|nr:M23 family metallopeptidase [Alphaproteobacteria bacterium]
KRDVAIASLPPVAATEPRPAVTPPVEDPETAAEPPPARGTGRFAWPVRGKVVLGYGPQTGGLRNDGINIAAPRGTRVRAADAGVVAYAGNELRGFGNLIVIRHADGWMTAYAHNEALNVQKGDAVRRGQTIARVGQTGNVTAPQLHFEVRRGQRPIDPMPYMAGAPDDGVVTSTGGRGDRRDPG